MKRLSLLDLPILLLLGALVFAIGCPDDVTKNTPSLSVNGSDSGVVDVPVVFNASPSANLSGDVVWAVTGPADVTTTLEEGSNTSLNNEKCTFTPTVVGTYEVTATVGTNSKMRKIVVGAAAMPPTVNLRAEDATIPTTAPRVYTIPANAYAVNPSTATKTWSIKSSTCSDMSSIVDGVLTVPTVYGTDCQVTVKLSASNSAGTNSDTVVLFIEAKPLTGTTGGTGGSL
ncbi:MAG: hypothetical protein C0621_09470 [Desulfuromonas sp.]|nr:MAG: hypothetical protein C0621_09470 [Desulfuromonas sp.]